MASRRRLSDRAAHSLAEDTITVSRATRETTTHTIRDGQLYYSVWAPFAQTEHTVPGRHLCDSMQLIATYHRKHGRLAEAEASFKHVLELKQQVCQGRPEPPPHCELADTLNDLGLVHLKQGGEKLGDAEACFRQALQIRVDDGFTVFQRRCGEFPRRPPDPDTAVAYNNLGLALLKRQKLAEAEECLTLALQHARRGGHQGLGAPLELANITRNLATCHTWMGKDALAKEGFEVAELSLAAHHEALRAGGAVDYSQLDERLARADVWGPERPPPSGGRGGGRGR